MGEIRYIISDASKKIDVEPHALRYWEEELGLDIPRNEMGHRYYREEDVKILRNVKLLKEQGFQLRAIKMILPNIHKIETLDAKSMLLLRNELNERVFELESRQELKEKQNVVTEPEENDYNNLIHLDEVRSDHMNNDGIIRLHKEDMGVQDLRTSSEDKTLELHEDNKKNELNPVEPSQEEIVHREDKMIQFKNIMSDLIINALRENTDELAGNIGKVVSLSMAKELDYQFREKEQREEERYKHLDETIRAFQRGRAEIAAAQSEGGKRKNRFKRKELI
ncbi:MerR family transcriptional regulator [Anaerosporobacter faecicola]|uniref:MerR family transcriptional regulator n=1 Tax=Anaerosporobacter faecicola TaxID=2718714 RepID=UPI00143B3698|nr:MerR family transcriptional regulator [Anaerosporobacter faecicola]